MMASVRDTLRTLLIVIGTALFSLLCALFLLFYVIALLSDFAREFGWPVVVSLIISVGVSAGYLFLPGFWMLLAGRWLPSARLRKVGKVMLLLIFPLAVPIAAIRLYGAGM